MPIYYMHSYPAVINGNNYCIKIHYLSYLHIVNSWEARVVPPPRAKLWTSQIIMVLTFETDYVVDLFYAFLTEETVIHWFHNPQTNILNIYTFLLLYTKPSSEVFNTCPPLILIQQHGFSAAVHHLAVPFSAAGLLPRFPSRYATSKDTHIRASRQLRIVAYESQCNVFSLSLCGAAIKLEVVQSWNFHLQAKLCEILSSVFGPCHPMTKQT